MIGLIPAVLRLGFHNWRGLCAKRTHTLACFWPNTLDSRVLSVIRGSRHSSRKDPKKVQKHFSKMFAGVVSLILEENMVGEELHVKVLGMRLGEAPVLMKWFQQAETLVLVF